MKSTKVILNEDVYNLGEEGDVCEVAPGYARNYLVPRGLAVPYNRQNISRFEERRSSIEKRKEEKRDAAKTVKDRIESLEIVMETESGWRERMDVIRGLVGEACAATKRFYELHLPPPEI